MSKQDYHLSEAQLREYLSKPRRCPWCGGEVIASSLEADDNYASCSVCCAKCDREWDDVYRLVGTYVSETQEHHYLPETAPCYDGRLRAMAPELLAVCQEIAHDPKVDLVCRERRLRLYQVLNKAQAL